MALNDKVTLDQYDQTLRDAVNAYYEHAMNDPSMSKEEALESTAQMAENYLAATEEFQDSMAAEQTAESTQVATEVGNEVSNDGLEGGSEGGLDSDGGIE